MTFIQPYWIRLYLQATRRKLKSIAGKKAKDLKHELRSNIIKRCAVKDILDQERYLGILDKPFTANDSYTTTEPSTSKSCLKNFDSNDESDYISSEESSPQRQSKWIGNIHNVNIATDEFKSLPADVRYDILTDLKDTRKQNSWGRLHEMPTVSSIYTYFKIENPGTTTRSRPTRFDSCFDRVFVLGSSI